MSDTVNETSKRKPTHKLAQEVVYYVMDRNGNRQRKTKTIDLAFGWIEVSQNGKNFISFADEVQPVFPDADGRIKRVVFQLNYDES